MILYIFFDIGLLNEAFRIIFEALAGILQNGLIYYWGNCYRDDCTNCCNYYGYCPEDYSKYANDKYNTCYYYYPDNTSSSDSSDSIAGSVTGAVIGGIFAFIICVVVFIYCRKKRAEESDSVDDESNNNPNGNTETVKK